MKSKPMNRYGLARSYGNAAVLSQMSKSLIPETEMWGYSKPCPFGPGQTRRDARKSQDWLRC